MVLFLDDDQHRAALAYQRWPEEKRDKTIWATTAQEAIDVLRDYDLVEAHLDHDLGGETYVNSEREDCGMEVVRWLEDLDNVNKFKDTKFIVHSHNYPAGAEMMSRLKKLDLTCVQIPFGHTQELDG